MTLPRRSARALSALVAVSLVLLALPHPRAARAESEEQEAAERAREANNIHVVNPRKGQGVESRRINAISTTVVNFSELARNQALRAPKGPPRVLDMEAMDNHVEPLEALAETAPSFEIVPRMAPTMAQVVSPAPTKSYMGLDDIPMQDSLFIIIPPDCGGAVGPTKVMQGLNNNYRILDKATGAVLSTVGTATFWAPSGETDLLGLTDPRTLYDPYNNRWIAIMQTISTQNYLVGVSQTSDPSGSWFLYRFNVGFPIDFPIVGFNKNWIAITINRYSNLGTFTRGLCLAVNYPSARTGTGTGTLFTQAMNSHFCSAPAMTMSATEDTLFVLTHLTSSTGTYTLETITGTASAPVYNVSGTTLTRPGGGWTQPNIGGSTQILPQSAPNSGTSSCGATPCKMETQDSQIRSAPVYRAGFLYYTQTIGLPAGTMTRTAVQWTKLTTGGAFLDGGRLDDATAAKWYAYPHIAVNSAGDFLIGYSQFGSGQHPGAGYSYHDHTDAAGTLRDPFIYKPGEDYYHKDFGSGRNRWGDFSQVNVDPSDDQTLWAIQEYGKTRVGTDDGTTGANGSRWSTYWAAVNPTAPPPPTVTIATPGPSQAEGNSGTTAFNFTVNLSAASASPVQVNYATADGSATVANNDYQPATSFITIPAGSTSGVIPINVVGDTTVEANETFTVTLTGATGGTLGSPVVATATIQNDDNYVITASAGPNGSITPSGAVSVPPGGSQGFTIAPNACYHIQDVLVDGVSQGAITNFTFNAVAANHTISATFAINVLTITASAGSGGTITPSGSVPVNCGASQGFSIAANTGFAIADVQVDGVSQGAIPSFTFTNVTAPHTIAATFSALNFTITASAGTGGAISPSGPVSVPSGSDQAFGINPNACFHILDVLVDGVSQGAIATFTFTAVSANHTIAASFAPDRLLSVGNVVQVEGNTGTTDFDFPVRLSGPCTQQVDVGWKTADGTATVADSDFQADSTALSLAPGVTTGTITVHVNGDFTPENTETFFVNLFDPVNAGIDQGQGVGTILNDDGLSAAEGTSLRETSFAIQGNPTGGAIGFRIGLPAQSSVDLSVYDISGRRVALLLHDAAVGSGYHTVTWNPRGKAVPGSGVYFVRLTTGGKTMTRRFVLLR